MAEAKKEKSKKVTVEALQYAVGRRKRSIARVRMVAGKGEITINGKPAKAYTGSEAQLKEFLKPLVVAGMTDTHDFVATVIGGGVTGQLGAVQLGVARCIAKINDDLKKSMRQNSLITRDPREKERKKVYRIGARKAPQFSKR